MTGRSYRIWALLNNLTYKCMVLEKLLERFVFSLGPIFQVKSIGTFPEFEYGWGKTARA